MKILISNFSFGGGLVASAYISKTKDGLVSSYSIKNSFSEHEEKPALSIDLSPLDFMSLGESLRESLQRKKSSWSCRSENSAVTLSVKVSEEQQLIYISLFSPSPEREVTAGPFSVWESRALIKRLDLFSECVEKEVFSMEKKINLTKIKKNI